MENKIKQSEKGKVFVRKSDGMLMGFEIQLGTLPNSDIEDSFDNYEEVDITEEHQEILNQLMIWQQD